MGELPDYEATILRACNRLSWSTGWRLQLRRTEFACRVSPWDSGPGRQTARQPSRVRIEKGWPSGKPSAERAVSCPSFSSARRRQHAQLHWDSESTAILNHLYRIVHDEPAPISRIVQIVGKFGVPIGDREHPIIEYLTHPAIYGEGFNEMRKAMAIVVDCFRQERGQVVPPIPGDDGLTAQFLALAGPAQATICGSSSFRLDLVAKYLSMDGPDEYFRRGLQIEHQVLDAKRLADDVLDEVLGVYSPPDVKYEDHDQYVAAALAVPRNRARANAVYVSLLKQIGTMWGTLLGCAAIRSANLLSPATSGCARSGARGSGVSGWSSRITTILCCPTRVKPNIGP